MTVNLRVISLFLVFFYQVYSALLSYIFPRVELYGFNAIPLLFSFYGLFLLLSGRIKLGVNRYTIIFSFALLYHLILFISHGISHDSVHLYISLYFVFIAVPLSLVATHIEFNPGAKDKYVFGFFVTLSILISMLFMQENINFNRTSLESLDSNSLAKVAIMLFILCIYILQSMHSVLLKKMLYLSAVVLIYFLAATNSVGIFFAFIVSTLLLLYYKSCLSLKRSAQILLALIVFFLVSYFFHGEGWHFLDRISTLVDNNKSSLYSRLGVYGHSLDLLSSFRIFGHNFVDLETASPHNLFLELFLYGGLLSLVIFIYLIMKAFIFYRDGLISGQISDLLFLMFVFSLLVSMISGWLFTNYIFLGLVLKSASKGFKLRRA